MSAIKTVAGWLLADPAIAKLVGDGVYPYLIPEGRKLPVIVIQRISTVPQNCLQGFAGLDLNTLLVDVYSTDEPTALKVRDAARANLDTNGLVMENESEDYDPNMRSWRLSMQWQIWTNPLESSTDLQAESGLELEA